MLSIVRIGPKRSIHTEKLVSALRRACAGAVLLVVLLPGSALAQLYATPIGNPDKPYLLDGYSVLPPRGSGWFEMKRDRASAYFGKRLSSLTHSFIAVAMSSSIVDTFQSIDGFRDYVTTQLEGTTGDQRNKVLQVVVATDTAPGSFCVRYQIKTEDRGAANAPGRALLAESFGISCLHPDRRDLAIDISYTERGLPAETGTLLRNEGESFIRSLRFTTAQ
jgi:hypothetical protein